jgi:hypothetical protein
MGAGGRGCAAHPALLVYSTRGRAKPPPKRSEASKGGVLARRGEAGWGRGVACIVCPRPSKRAEPPGGAACSGAGVARRVRGRQWRGAAVGGWVEQPRAAPKPRRAAPQCRAVLGGQAGLWARGVAHALGEVDGVVVCQGWWVGAGEAWRGCEAKRAPRRPRARRFSATLARAITRCVCTHAARALYPPPPPFTGAAGGGKGGGRSLERTPTRYEPDLQWRLPAE